MRHLILPLLILFGLPLSGHLGLAHAQGFRPGIHIEGPELSQPLNFTLAGNGTGPVTPFREAFFCVTTGIEAGDLFTITIDAPNISIGGQDVPYRYSLSNVDVTGDRTALFNATVVDAPVSRTTSNLETANIIDCINGMQNMRFSVDLPPETIDLNITGTARVSIMITVTAQ